MTKSQNILKVAFGALGRNKLRSLLTTLGIIIGVACVVATIGIGDGARIQAQDQLRSLGTNFLMIFPGAITSSGARSGLGGSSKLSEDDVDAIRREVPAAAYVSASNRTVAQVIYGNQNWSTQVRAVNPAYFSMNSWSIAQGAFFDQASSPPAVNATASRSQLVNAWNASSGAAASVS